MIAGISKNVLIVPKLNKNIDEKETFVPFHIDLRNGYLSDAGNWIKRHGNLQDSTNGWDLGTDLPVSCLIPKYGGYAVQTDNNIFALSGSAPPAGSVMSPRVLNGSSRPAWDEFGGDIIIVNGGVPAEISAGIVSALGGTPPHYHFIGRIGGYVLMAEKGGITCRYSTVNNHEDWPTENFFNVKKQGVIKNMLILHENVYFLKDEHIEVWTQLGGTTPFARIDSQTIEKGCGASYSALKANDTFYWYGNDHEFYRWSGGTQYEAISHGYGNRVKELLNPSEIYGLDFRNENCIRWFAPTNGIVFKYGYKYNDFSEDNLWTSGQWKMLPYASYMELNGKQYAGSSALDGLIYRIDKSFYTDNGSPIRVYRRFNIKLTEDGRQARINGFRFRGKRGAANSDVSNPVLVYRYKLPGQGWTSGTSIDMGIVGDSDPWIDDLGPKGIGREIEMEVWHTDATEFVLTDMQVIVNPMGR